MAVSEREKHETALAAHTAALEALGRDEAMQTRLRASQESLNAVRVVIDSSKTSIAQLDLQVAQHLETLVAAVETSHVQNGHFFQLSEAGSRAADNAAVALKNIISARFHARAQLAAHERRLTELQAALAK